MKFVCDDNLGRLARWLRTLGYDTAHRQDFTDEHVLEIALTESRTILTRDRTLADKVLAREVMLVRSSDPLEQLAQVLQTLPETIPQPFTRCSRCNRRVTEIQKEDCEHEIPPHVYRTHDQFYRCETCKRIFWAGTHVQHMKESLRRLGIVFE